MRFSVFGCQAFLKIAHKYRFIVTAAIVGSSLILFAFGAGMAMADGDYTTHVVAKGENIFRLSLVYGVRISSILDANGITDPDYVEAGRVLLIPKNDQPLSVEAPVVRPAVMVVQAKDSQNPTHVVQRGENLFRIALQYQVDLRRLLEANGLSNPDHVEAGQQLTIPLAPVATPVRSIQPSPPPVVVPALLPEPQKATSADDDWDDTFHLTHYCLNGPMSSGKLVYSGAVAADKSILSLGKKLIIEGLGQFVVEDRFAWDAGQKRLDIWVPTCWEAVQRGVQYRRVKVLN